MKKTLINYLGLSGAVAFFSYLAAVVFSARRAHIYFSASEKKQR